MRLRHGLASAAITIMPLAVVPLAGACTTDQPKVPVVIDAGAAPAPASAPDAGSPPDAGPPAIVDAGAAPMTAALVDAGAAPALADPATQAVRPAKDSIFNHLLVKPRVRGTEPAEIKALIEEKTGLKVELARRTAGSWVMVQLVAIPGGRDAKDQRKAVEQLQALGVFEVVEADRMMKVKMP